MKKLLAIVSAVMLLASCESNRSTFVDVEDGKMFTLNCGHHDQYLSAGDTIVYVEKIRSSSLRTDVDLYGVYNGKAIPKDTDWDHWSAVDSSYSYYSATYHLAIKID
jgi:hypothetical protein